jgi:hypothetical protein
MSDLSLAKGKYLVCEFIASNLPGPQAVAQMQLSLVVPPRFVSAVRRHSLHLANLSVALQAAGLIDETARDLVECALDGYRDSLMSAIWEEGGSPWI